MLLLTRRIGESVVIGEEVFCTVIGYWGDQVRLAFDAPPSIPVHRDEIQRVICRDRQEYDWFYNHAFNKENIVERLIKKFKHAENHQ